MYRLDDGTDHNRPRHFNSCVLPFLHYPDEQQRRKRLGGTTGINQWNPKYEVWKRGRSRVLAAFPGVMEIVCERRGTGGGMRLLM